MTLTSFDAGRQAGTKEFHELRLPLHELNGEELIPRPNVWTSLLVTACPLSSTAFISETRRRRREELLRQITTPHVDKEQQNKKTISFLKSYLLERRCEGTCQKVRCQVYELATKYVSRLEHQMGPEDDETEGELEPVRSHVVLKCFYFARLGRPDIFWTVNMSAMSVTKWTKHVATCQRD